MAIGAAMHVNRVSSDQTNTAAAASACSGAAPLKASGKIEANATTPAAAATTRIPKAPKGFFGIVPQTPVTEKDAEYMKAGGIEAVRTPLIWPAVQPTKKGPYNWGAFDPVVEEAARQGLSVLPFIIATPKWVAGKETTLPINNATQRKA